MRLAEGDRARLAGADKPRLAGVDKGHFANHMEVRPVEDMGLAEDMGLPVVAVDMEIAVPDLVDNHFVVDTDRHCRSDSHSDRIVASEALVPE